MAYILIQEGGGEVGEENDDDNKVSVGREGEEMVMTAATVTLRYFNFTYEGQ